MKKQHPNYGGARKGAGRPKNPNLKPYTLTLDSRVMEAIPGNRSRFTREAIKAKLVKDGLAEEE